MSMAPRRDGSFPEGVRIKDPEQTVIWKTYRLGIRQICRDAGISMPVNCVVEFDMTNAVNSNGASTGKDEGIQITIKTTQRG